MDLTSALVTWDPPFPPNQTVGYQVYYTGPTNGSVTADVFGAQTGSTTVTGLLNGGVYSFSVAGKSAQTRSRLTEVLFSNKWWDCYVTSSVTWTQYIIMSSIIFEWTSYKSPDVMSRTAIHYSHTTDLGIVNCSFSTIIISKEGQWQSPLVGSDLTTHLTVWSSTDREED